MAFSVGESVLLVTLKRRGEIVEARGQQYRVSLGALTVTCREADLRALDSSASRTRRSSTPASAGSPSAPLMVPSGAGPVSSIDLHGMTTIEAREALLRYLDIAFRAGHAIVEVVHGIGTGRVRAAVLAAARDVPSVRSVRPHPTNRGVTLVYL